MNVGSGDRARLWFDFKVDGRPLVEAFPRIHALACNKLGFVRNLGRCVNDFWEWEVKLRRPVFNWEVQ